MSDNKFQSPEQWMPGVDPTPQDMWESCKAGLLGRNEFEDWCRQRAIFFVPHVAAGPVEKIFDHVQQPPATEPAGMPHFVLSGNRIRVEMSPDEALKLAAHLIQAARKCGTRTGGWFSQAALLELPESRPIAARLTINVDGGR